MTRTCVSFSRSPRSCPPSPPVSSPNFPPCLSLLLLFFFLSFFIAHVTRLFIVLYTRASKLRCYRYSLLRRPFPPVCLSIFRRFARSNLDKVYIFREQSNRRRNIRIEYIVGGKRRRSFLSKACIFYLLFFFAHPRQNLQFEVRKKRVEGI